MKAIVLTYAPITKEEKKLLKQTDIFKIACNNYCAELKPDIRLCADDIVQKCLDCDSCDVVSLNYDLELRRVINGCRLPQRHSTLLSCIDYLYLKGFTSVLLVASNPDSATCKINYEGINDIKDCLYLYKYTKEGNFDIEHKSIKDFIMQTEEERLLGIEETPERKLFKKTIFTDAVKYEVSSENANNKSIESGYLINNILPASEKQKLLEGIEEIKYNGLIIKMLTNLKPQKAKKEEIKEKNEEEKPVKKVVKKGKN